jgi:hypothetical protein
VADSQTLARAAGEAGWAGKVLCTAEAEGEAAPLPGALVLGRGVALGEALRELGGLPLLEALVLPDARTLPGTLTLPAKLPELAPDAEAQKLDETVPQALAMMLALGSGEALAAGLSLALRVRSGA